MIRYKIVCLIGVFCSAVCFVGIAQTQTEYGLQKWSTFNGLIQIDLPQEWKPANGQEMNDMFMANKHPQIAFTRTDGQGSMRMILFENQLETDGIRVVQDSMVAICNHVGLTLQRAETIVIDGRDFTFAEGGCTRFDRQVWVRVWATLMNDRLLLIVFTGRGNIRGEVLFDARFAMSSLVIKEAEFSNKEENEKVKLSKPGEFVGLSPKKVGGIFLPERGLETREIPGYGITLKLPVDFREAILNPGFVGPDNSTRIAAFPSALPYGLARAQYNPSVFWRWEGTLMESHDIEVDGRPGVLTLSKHGTAKNEYFRWMLMTGNKEKSILLLSQFEWEPLGEVSSTLRSSLMTVKWDPSVAPNSLDGLEFSFSESPRLKVFQRFDDRVILAPEGSFGLLQKVETYLSIESFYNPVPIEDLTIFAEECAETVPQVAWVSVNSVSEIMIGGLRGIELLGTITLTENEQKKDFYQALTVLDGVVFLVQGFQELNAPVDLKGEFAQVSNSLEIH